MGLSTKKRWDLQLYLCCGICLSTFKIGCCQQAKIDEVMSHYHEGRELYYVEEYRKSIESFDKALVLARELKEDSLICKVLTRKGHSYLLDGEYQKALDSYYLSLDIVQNIGDVRQEIILLSGLVTTLKRMGQLEEAHKLTTKMINLVDKSTSFSKSNHARVLTTANEIYMALEQYDSVLYFADKGIEISKEIDFKQTLVHLYIEKGMAYYYKSDIDKSFNYLLKAKDLLNRYKISQDFFPTVLVNYYLASCHYSQENFDKAIAYLFKSIDLADEQDHKKMFVIQCYLLLANCYGEQKDFEKALKYNKEYIRLNASYEKEKDATANKIYEKNAKILQMNLKRLKMERKSELKIKKYTYTGLWLVSILLLTLSLIYITKQRSNKYIFNDLMAKIDLLENQQQELSVKGKSAAAVVIDDEKLTSILEKIDQLELEHYFLRVDCTLTTMAKKLKTNATYLSKIINTHKEKNFSSYINDLRIDFVVNRLRQDPVFRKYKIKAIAQEVGFKSAESFAKSFYKRTGLYPSYFLKQLQRKV